MPIETLFIYLDESGNFDFTHTGTGHLVMSAICTSNPSRNLKVMGETKYKLLASGIDLANFHASEDVQKIRDLVFASLAKLSIFSTQTFWISKKDSRFLYTRPIDAYRIFGSAFAKWAELQKERTGASSVVLVFDRALTAKEQRIFLSTTKSIFSGLGAKYCVFFHNVHKDFNGQVADYIAWAQYVKLERGEHRPFQALPVHLCQSDNLFDWLESQ